MSAHPVSASELARHIASELAGFVVPVPGEGDACCVAYGNGQVALLLRGFERFVSLSGPGVRARQVQPEPRGAARLAHEIASEAKSARRKPEAVSLLDLGLALASQLSVSLGERWTVSIPGVPDPNELWLHGAVHAAAAVGVNGRHALVWIRDRLHRVPATALSDLPTAAARVLELVREQQQLYAEHVEQSLRIEQLAEELASKLGARVTAPGKRGWKHEAIAARSPAHDAAVARSVFAQVADKRREVATIQADRGVIRVVAGLDGDQGWQGELTAVDDCLDQISLAVARRLGSLTVDELTRGQRYRVLLPRGDLKTGQVVTFTHFEDIDNHFSCYVFQVEGAGTARVCGDCTSRAGNPLRDAHRYLERVED